MGQSWWALSAKENDFRSQCPHCHNALKIRDLVPFFSWALSKGKCRYCGHNIGLIYPLTELGSGLICAFIGSVFSISFQGFMLCFLIPFIISFFIVFYQKKRVSIRLLLIISGLLLGVIAAFAAGRNFTL